MEGAQTPQGASSAHAREDTHLLMMESLASMSTSARTILAELEHAETQKEHSNVNVMQDTTMDQQLFASILMNVRLIASTLVLSVV
jgi:hypothetical protein